MYIQLNHIITEDSPIFPGNPRTEFVSTTSIERGDASNTTELRTFTHNGTHVDVPYHFNSGGKTVDAYKIEEWIFTSPLLIDCSTRLQHQIELSDLESALPGVRDCDLLLLYSGMCNIRDSNPQKYLYESPWLSKDAARFIIDRTNIKALAIDFLSVESLSDAEKGSFEVHQILCGCPGKSEKGKGILIFEDVNLAPLVGKKILRVFAIPLYLKGIDGSPVTVFAEVG